MCTIMKYMFMHLKTFLNIFQVGLSDLANFIQETNYLYYTKARPQGSSYYVLSTKNTAQGSSLTRQWT